jgi:hypothetical protein
VRADRSELPGRVPGGWHGDTIYPFIDDDATSLGSEWPVQRVSTITLSVAPDQWDDDAGAIYAHLGGTSSIEATAPLTNGKSSSVTVAIPPVCTNPNECELAPRIEAGVAHARS